MYYPSRGLCLKLRKKQECFFQYNPIIFMQSSILTKDEAKLAEHLTSIGLAHAASAFSMLTNDRVTFKKMGFNSRDFLKEEPKGGLPMQMLFTPFIGDVLFDSYLIVSHQDGLKIAESIMPGMPVGEDMVKAVLLELDNIISAAVATKYANLLQRNIAGDVPRTYRKSYAELKQHLTERAEKFDSCYSCNTRFKLVHTKAEAEYVFFFQEGFEMMLAELAGVKGAVEDINYQANTEARRFIG